MSTLLDHFYLKLGGSNAPEELMRDLGSVEVDDHLFLPDMFTIQIRDPGFTWVESPLLKVGQEVEILAAAASPDGQPTPKRLIVGEITSVEPEYPYNGVPVVLLRGYDRAHRLHRGKKTRSFVQMTDSDIITKIAQESGLKVDADATSEVYAYILENNQTDFEFIMERARRIGFNFLVDDRTLVFKKPANLPSETVELEYGKSLRQFRPRMSTASQFKEVVVKGWDLVNRREIIGRADGGKGAGTDGAGNGGGGNGSSPGGSPAGSLGGLGDQAASSLNQAAQQAMGFATHEAAGEIQAAKSAVQAAIPPELKGAADLVVQKGMQLAADYLPAEAMSAVNAVMSGDASQIAQVGMELGAEVVEKAFGEAGTLLVTQHPVGSQAEADALAKSIFAELSGGNLQAEGVSVGDPTLTAGCKVKLSALGNKFSGTYFVTHTRHLYDALDGYLTEFTISGRSPNTLEDLLVGGAGTNPGLTGNGAPDGVVVGLVTNNNDPQGMGRVKVKFPWLDDNQESDWARVATPMSGGGRGLFILPEVDDEVLVIFEHGDINHPYVIGSLWNGIDKPPIDTGQALDGNGKVIQRVWKTRSGHTITLDDSDDSPGIQIVDQTGNNKIVIDSKNNNLSIEVQGDVAVKAQGKITLQADSDVEIKAQGSLKLEGTGGVEVKSDATVKVQGATIDLN